MALKDEEFADLIYQVSCGSLNWLCQCMDLPRFITLTRLMRSASDAQLMIIWREACGCNAQMNGKGNPTPGQPGTSPPSAQCLTRFRDVICRKDVQEFFQRLRKVFVLISSVPGVGVDPSTPGAGGTDWNKLITTIDLLLAACAAGGGSAMIQQGIITEFCTQYTIMKTKVAALPEWAQGMVKTLALAGPSDFLALIAECCGA